MGFYFYVEDDKITCCGNEEITSGSITSYAVDKEVYYNYVTHPDRYKFENGAIVEDASWIERFAAENEEGFKKEFFNTSLGWIRRNVSMATGDKKDFLTDLLPAIAQGLAYGQAVQIIAYALPDFTKDLTDEYMITLQTKTNATAAFVQECFNQIAVDFAGITK